MLMPSCMCLCQLAPCGMAALQTDRLSAAVERSPLSCAPHQCGRHDDGEDVSVATDGPSRVPDPGHSPQDHCPNCPNCPVLNCLLVRVAVPADTAAVNVYPPAGAADWAGPSIAPTSGRGPPEPSATPPTPLFISHCTLLI
jgi:hypothetical protein